MEHEWQNYLADVTEFRLRQIRYDVGILSIFNVLAQNDSYFNFNFFSDDLQLLSLTEQALEDSFSLLEEFCESCRVLLLKNNVMVYVCLT